jgi:hypothetical protein
MEAAGIAQAVHDHVDVLAAELGLDRLERALKREPEVDLLRGSAGGDLAREAGDALDGLDPCVDVRVQEVQERVIVQQLRWQVGDAGSSALFLGLWERM